MATNVAETSLTIPGIRYVVDTGVARIAQYQPGTRINSLPISPDLAEPRPTSARGGAAASQTGLCVRLYSRGRLRVARRVHPARDPAVRPGRGHPAHDRPGPRRSAPVPVHRPARRPRPSHDGYDTLVELGAIEDGTRRRRSRRCPPEPRANTARIRWELTETGRTMARMQVDPRLSRMLIEARAENCLPEVAVLAAALSIRDPRERPPEKAAAGRRRPRRLQASGLGLPDPAQHLEPLPRRLREARRRSSRSGASATRTSCRSRGCASGSTCTRRSPGR
ncbi:MAG: hypothetical protein M0C28_40280 [Candidatus Moduliflexus flocculans]|nr:hypothetical protein [Candidatus Moduliflexus flocculans]